MNKARNLAAATLLLVLLGACAGADVPAPDEADAQRQASITRSVLADSLISARAYGQASLGHFLDLDSKRLQREGLEIPAMISVKVRTTHTSFCITAINASLPSIHPWATGTVTYGESRPSSDDRCELDHQSG